MVQKVYIVIGTDAPSYGDSSWVHDVFMDKAMAEKCAEICSNISASEGNSYYVDEREIKTYDLDTKTAEYYSYNVNKEKPFNDILQMTDVYYELVDYLDLPNKKFDFHIGTNLEKGYIIEYDGQQHFFYTGTGWDTQEHYERTHANDLRKNLYCFRNNIPLIRIPYDTNYTINDLKLETTRFLLTPENEEEYYNSRSN